MIHEAENLLQEFVAYVRATEEQGEILSLYLMVDPSEPANRAATPAWRVFLRNGLADIESKLDPEQTKQWKNVRLGDRSERTRWARVRLRLENYLSDYRPTGKTLVLFIAPDGELEYELPVRLQNHAHYGWPQMTEFLWALDEYQEYLVVLFAQDRARALNMFLGASADDVLVHVDQTWQRKERKTAHFDQVAQRHDEIDRRFARYAASELNQHFMESDDVERVILGGNMQLAHAVRGYLHPSVAERVVAKLQLPIETPAHDVAAAIRDVAESYEREQESILVSELVGRAKAGGRAALGMAAVNEALDRQAVSLLVLPYPIDPAVADALFEKAVFSSSHVEFVEGDAARALENEGGVAARLYYAV